MKFSQLFVAACLALLVQPVAGSAAVKVGGKIKGKQPAAVQSAFPSPENVIAYHLYNPSLSKSTTLNSGGAFNLSLPAGPYILIANAERGNSRTSLAFVNVPKSGKKMTATFTALKTPRSARLGARAASVLARNRAIEIPNVGGLPKGPVVSVGKILPVDLQGNQRFRDDGKEIRHDIPFISDLMNANGGCKLEVVEDQETGAFNFIKKEIKLRSSKAVAASQRLNYKKATQALNAWAPQYRLVGTVAGESFASPEFTVNLHLIDLATGETRCPRQYTARRETFFSGFSQMAANDIARLICGDPLPKTIRGTYSGVLNIPVLGAVENFNGDISFELQNGDAYKDLPILKGSEIYAAYTAQSALLRWQISGGNICTYTGSATSPVDNPASQAIELQVAPKLCEERKYLIVGTLGVDTPTTIDVECSGVHSPSPKYYGGSINSESDEAFRKKTSAGKLLDSFSDGVQTWNWDLDEIN
jgi:hypothetical protein